MRSPAEPASSLALSAALYSVGAIGAKTTLMPGFAFSKTGISFSCQMARSSLRQLSMLSVTSSAKAVPVRQKMLEPKRSAVIVFLVISILPVDLFQVPCSEREPPQKRDNFKLSRHLALISE